MRTEKENYVIFETMIIQYLPVKDKVKTKRITQERKNKYFVHIYSTLGVHSTCRSQCSSEGKFFLLIVKDHTLKNCKISCSHQSQSPFS